MTNPYPSYFRKNYARGVMQIQLLDAPRYPDDPLYDELVLTTDHTLPTAADGCEIDREMQLVIWSNTDNPGWDPGMEIVTCTRTAHPQVYQITQRGAENTPIGAHAVDSYVGLHYTAGVSNNDLQPIIDMLAASVGTIVYTWEDLSGNRKIGILPPGLYGQVLVTAGDDAAPFWDWVWGAPGAMGGGALLEILMYSVFQFEVITVNLVFQTTETLEAEHGTDEGPNPDWFDVDNEQAFNTGSGEDFGQDVTITTIAPDVTVDADQEGKFISEYETLVY